MAQESMGQRMGLRVDAVKASKQMEQDIIVRLDKKHWMKKVFVKLKSIFWEVMQK